MTSEAFLGLRPASAVLETLARLWNEALEAGDLRLHGLSQKTAELYRQLC